MNGKQPVAVGNQVEAALNNKGEHQAHETLKMKQYETEVIRLNTQLDTHKVKLMELNHEKDKLSKLVHDYKKQNQVYNHTSLIIYYFMLTLITR